jgi:histidinol phosphatase-like enzyme (inositol monophosphatase family)
VEVDTRESDLELALALADDAREIARRWFRTGLAVERKADATPVTRADREIEARMRSRLAAERPDDGIVGEEHGAERVERRRVWVLDPIDGTNAFFTASPLFGTLIALSEGGLPSLGVVELPALGERLVGRDGAATRDGVACRVRPCERLADAVCATPGPRALPPHIDAALWDAVAMRRWGGDCYAYCQLAMGGIDLVVEQGMAPHDFMALVPVVTGAGGVITDWTGAPLTLASGGQVVAAATPRLHQEALALLSAA